MEQVVLFGSEDRLVVGAQILFDHARHEATVDSGVATGEIGVVVGSWAVVVSVKIHRKTFQNLCVLSSTKRSEKRKQHKEKRREHVTLHTVDGNWGGEESED